MGPEEEVLSDLSWKGLPVRRVTLDQIVPSAGVGPIYPRVLASLRSQGMINPLVVSVETVESYKARLIDKSLEIFVVGKQPGDLVYVVWVGNNRWFALRAMQQISCRVAVGKDHVEARSMESPSKEGWEQIYEP